MLIEYGSFMYFAYILAVLFVCGILYALIKNRSNGVKKLVVFLISLLNFAQHIFKGKIYPQYQNGFSVHLSTAYNVCAFLILVSPFIILFGKSLAKNFITYVGSFAGMIAMVVPYWFIGKSAFGWEVYRFYICHGLLFVSSVLPALVGLHKPEWKHCWKIGLLFFVMLTVILINDGVLVALGYYPVSEPDDVYASLYAINPCWSMHPPANFAWVVKIFNTFTPSFLLGENPWGICIPILWYAIPMYFGITLLAHAACGLSKALAKFHKYNESATVQY